MCLEEFGLKFIPLDKWPGKAKKNICNEKLSVNRALVCCALAAYKKNSSGPLKCLDGNSGCGVNGMLWEKYLRENLEVTINPSRPEETVVVQENLKCNDLEATVLDESVNFLLRKECYDFIFINCNTMASHYFDSIFYRLNNKSLLVLTTSEDPSLYWQSPDVALRNYNGVITKTSYQRELSIRLIIAGMAQAAGRYNKGLTVHCVAGYKPQQSCTIIASVKKGANHANESLQNVRRLLHCSICENRKFIPISEFVFDSSEALLDCDCRKNSVGKIFYELGPIWSGEIFDCDFMSAMLDNCKGFPWENTVMGMLMSLVEEARCDSKRSDSPGVKKIKLMENSKSNSSIPYFYFNTHRHSSKHYHLIKLNKIIDILRRKGFRASRTHFDSEAVRTNASLKEYKTAVENYYSEHYMQDLKNGS